MEEGTLSDLLGPRRIFMRNLISGIVGNFLGALILLALAGCGASGPDGALKSILGDMEAMAVILEQDRASFESSRAKLAEHHQRALENYKRLINPKNLSYQDSQLLFERHREEIRRVARRLLKAGIAREYSLVDLPGLGDAAYEKSQSGERAKASGKGNPDSISNSSRSTDPNNLPAMEISNPRLAARGLFMEITLDYRFTAGEPALNNCGCSSKIATARNMNN
jgi:hypothetical protein